MLAYFDAKSVHGRPMAFSASSSLKFICYLNVLVPNKNILAVMTMQNHLCLVVALG